MRKNFKARIHDGEHLAGCFVMAPSPTMVEMCGFAGFDFVILDQEHGTSGTENLENQIRAAEASGTAAIVRVPWGERWLIQRALDAGAEGILVPHCMSAADAADIVRYCHYPPQGVRGLATTARAGKHGNVTTDEHLANSLERTVVIVQIEDREALPEAGAIARTEGIDSVFIGPADLSASLGRPGQPGHEDVAGAIEKVISDVAESGGQAKVSAFVRDPEDALLWRDSRRVPILCLSTAAVFTKVLRDYAQAMVAR